MANFLDDLSVYNAKAAAAITLAVTEGNSPKANLMSSLKTTANDTTLSDDVRLEALTALINIGNLLDIPLPPYFPIVTTYADSQTYVGVHNDLSGLNVGDYQHLTAAEKTAALNKASLTDINFLNLQGVYTQNPSLVDGFATKQDALNGTGYVKASGGTITYDNSTFLTTTLGVAKAETPGGELSGTYATPALNNGAVIGKVLTGFNGSASTGTITSSDSILTAFQKLNANVNDIASTAGTINEITFTLPSSVFDYTAGPFTSGTASISGSFIDQTQNTFFAAPSGGGSGQPYFRTIVAGDLPASGATAGSYGSSSTIPVLTVDAYGRITNISNVASASGGQVDTISYSVPTGIFNQSVTGANAVSITLGLEQQDANYVWAGPTSGAAAVPQFRALVAGDIPTGIPIANISGLQSALDSKMNYLLNDGEIWIGNASNAPTNKSLTGDVLMTREGVVTIQPNVVDFTKMQTITSGNLLGRWDASTPGDIQEVSLSADFVLDSGTGELSLAVPVAPILNSKGGLITYRQSIGAQVQLPAVFDGNLLITDSGEDDGLKWVTAQGDIEVDAALDGTFNITAGAVTLAKMANLAANSIIGNNNTGSAATPIALTPTQVTAMLDIFDTASTTKGLVPGSNSVGNTYYLDATGNWSVPAGSGGGTTTYPLTNGTGIQSFSFDGGTSGITVDIDNTVVTTLTDTQSLTNKTLSTGTAIDVGTPVVGTIWYSADTSGTVAALSASGAGGRFLSINSGTGLPEWATIGYATSAGSITGGLANQILYQTGAGATSFISAPTSSDTYLKWTGSAFAWAAVAGSGTVNAGTQYGIAYYPNATGSTVVDDITPPTAAAIQYFLQSNVVSAGTAVAPTWNASTGTGNVVLDTTPTIDTPTLLQPRVGNGSGNGHMHFRRGNTPGGLANFTTLAFLSASKTASFEFDTDGFQSQFLFAAASSTKTYTFPNLTGTVGIIDSTQALTLGINGTASGKLLLSGSTSGTITLQAPAAPTTTTYTLPTSAGSIGDYLQYGSAGQLSWSNPYSTGRFRAYKTVGLGTGVNGNTITVSNSVLIPAGTFSAGDMITFYARFYKSTASVLRVYNNYLYINTTNSLSGATLLATAQAGATQVNGELIRELSVLSSGGSGQSLIKNTTTPNTDWNNYILSTSALSTLTIDWSVDQYLIHAMAQSGGPTAGELGYSYGVSATIRA